MKELRKKACRSAAQTALHGFEKKSGPLRSPVPISEIAESLGYQVVFLSSVPDDFSALVSQNEKLIGINAGHHHHRQRFSIGHELGHILLNHPPESRCSREQIALYNEEADLCASLILMPESLIKDWHKKSKNEHELARIFDVSIDAMLRRLESLENG